MRFFARTFFVLLFFFIVAIGVAQAAVPTNAPTNLSAVYNGSTGLVYIYWTDNANDEMGFQLLRKLSTDTGWPTSGSGMMGFGAVTQMAPSSTQSNDPNTLPAGTYDYKLAACNNDGCSGFSNVASVTVGSSGSGSDTTLPSMPSGFNVAATVIGQNNLSWGASTDNVGVAGYKIYRCYGTYDCSNPSYFAGVGSNATSYNDTTVYSGIAYRYYVVAYDAAGNYSSPTPQILVTAAYDTTSPSAPSNLTASTPSSSQVALSWGASTDNVGVSQYAVYRNSSYLGYTTSCCGYTDSSVTAGGTYAYYVTAYDARGNISPASNSVTITVSSSTGAATSTADTILPVWPSSYTYGTLILSSSSIQITWTAASDNVGVYGYKIYRNGTTAPITTTTLLNYTDSGLAPSTTYNYAVAAYDAAGNTSTLINFNSVTTWGNTSGTTSTTTDTTVPVITNVRAENIMNPGAQIKWSTDDFSNSRVAYGVAHGTYSLFSDSRCDGGTAYDVSAHCVNLMNLTAGTVYYYKVESLNASGLDAFSVEYQFASAFATDTTPPTPPPAISSYAISASSISISWSGATDNTGVAGYKIYRNGAFLANTASLSYADTSLSPSTTYTYTIVAYDMAGNISASSFSTSSMTMTSSSATTGVSYASVSGKVTDSIGVAVASANVYLYSSANNRSYSAIAGTDGNYSISGVYPDTYQARVYPPAGVSYQSLIATTTLVAGQALVLDLKFPATSKIIKGKISYPDGRPVTNAGIGTYNSASGAWTNGYVDAQGAYATKVAGGKWQVNIYPKPSSTSTIQAVDWSYMEPPREVTFKDDASAEEMILDFTVKGAPVSVKGYALLPDGSAPLIGVAGVSLHSSSGFEYRSSIDSSGMFFIYLPADTYTGQIFSTDSRYGGVDIAAFSAVSGTMDLGKFYLKAQSEKIKGTVKDTSGSPVVGVWVNANQYMNSKYAQAKSGADGSFEIPVSAGEWSVQPYAEPMLGYSYNQSPKFVTVAVGGMATADFIMTKSDAQISGSIVDASGQVVSDASGYISTYIPSTTMTAMYSSPSFGGQIEKGNFNFKLPAGTYTLNVNFPPDSAYIPPSPQSVTVVSGETKKIDLTIVKTDVVLSGFLRDDSGNIIKGLGDDKIKAYLSTKGGTWRNLKIDSVTGTFSAQISAGTWYLGYWADPASGYVSSGKDVEIIAAAGESKKADIILLKTNSVISGTIKTADGVVLPNVWVSVSTRSFSAMSGSTDMTYGSSYVTGVSSDSSGKFEIKVPAGKYFLQSSYQMSSGYLNPPEIEVTVESGKTVTIEVVFKKPDATLSGVASVDGKGVPAYVWAWRESGGYVSARADESGKYSFAISRSSKWRVAASLEKNGAYYKTADVVVEVGDQAAVTQDLTLLSLIAIPAGVERMVETVKPQSVELQNGAKVVLPANALATSGSANIVMKPEVEVPSVGSTSIVGTGYKVEAKDEKGQGITNLNAEITVSIPYDEADLAAKGLKPEDLTLSFFDETTQTWKSIDKQVVDKENKTVSGMVSHLTLFALVAPADTTPPAAPSNVSVSTRNGAVELAWKNPTADFHHIKIYRSTQKGSLGEAVFNYLVAESKTDSVGNASYYYIARAVDLAGNESTNTAQYQAGVSSTSSVVESATATSPSAQTGILLVRVKGDHKVYAVENGKKHWIKSLDEFNAAGYKWSAITLIGAAQLAGYADQFATPFQFAITIKLGARSEAVRKLQELLARDKAIYPQGLVTGYYGGLTKAAVIRFQKKYKIKDQSGVAGAETRKKLNELSAL